MEVRADTYLWAIRMYKSRTIASEAIKAGKVKLESENFKPSHLVKVGETYTLNISTQKKIVKVIDLLDKRLSFEGAKKYYEDLSPPPIPSDKMPSVFYVPNIKRDKGLGRPTKKDRRDIDAFDY